MSDMNEALDIEIVQSELDDEFEVWTPDITGAAIAHGKTREEAARNAIANLGLTIADLTKLITQNETEKGA